MISRDDIEEHIIAIIAFAMAVMLIPWTKEIVTAKLGASLFVDLITYVIIYLVYEFGLKKVVEIVYEKVVG